MATSPFFHPRHSLHFPKCPFLPLNSPFPPRLHFLPRFPLSLTIRACMESETSTRKDQAKEADFFACPVCYEPLIRNGPSGLNVAAISRSGFKCKVCNKSYYSSKDVYLDLTVTAGLRVYTEAQPKNIEIFSNLGLLRADVSRLPFSSGSVDAVHAGAALHCWPSPSNAIAEISRTLRSGGVFVGTTFHRYPSSTPSTVQPLLEILVMQRYHYLTKEEIEDLCTSCGLTNYSCKIQKSFIMFSAQKP